MRCYKGGTHHKFEPRFTEKRIGSSGRYSGTSFDRNQIKKLFILQEYLFDICKWCGKKITKDNLK
uniref:Uncharacterized protein n=1 Tax=viral metagenome TaxID=1070528 RepID=A0A6M3L2Z9_9ZZZZ